MVGVQLPLGFVQPTASVTVNLAASGLRVLVEATHGTLNDAVVYLVDVGCGVESTATGISFPVADFARVRDLPDQVTVFADPVLLPLLEWVEHPCDDDLAVELDVSADGTLWMRWTSSGAARAEPLTAASTAALLAAEIPFIGTDAAFDYIRTTCHLPVLVGRCSLNRSGYITIDTTKPQMVEAGRLPGLFRLSETRYGLPLPHLRALNEKSGYVWDGQPPRIEPGPRVLPTLPTKLSGHSGQDLRSLVDSLAAYGTQAICWESGLGRRVFALAALASLDAFPALVVCRPERMWQWWRHVQLFHRSTDGHSPDVQLTTYDQFVADPSCAYDNQAIIFDDVASPEAAAPEVAAAAIGVAPMLDCYLIGITDELPEEPRKLVDVMSRLRPAEFNPSRTLVDTYGTQVAARLPEHVNSYVSRRRRADVGVDPAVVAFNHTQVLALEMPRTLRRAYAALAESQPDPRARSAAQARLVSAGTNHEMSPKIGTAMNLITEALAAGQRVAVVADDSAAALLVRLLRAWSPTVVHASSGATVPVGLPFLIAVGRGQLPDLSGFDAVIVVDYPERYSDLDLALGEADGEHGPSRVTLLHARGTVDDELAVTAAGLAGDTHRRA